MRQGTPAGVREWVGGTENLSGYSNSVGLSNCDFLIIGFVG